MCCVWDVKALKVLVFILGNGLNAAYKATLQAWRLQDGSRQNVILYEWSSENFLRNR
jgi:hypothetical protein